MILNELFKIMVSEKSRQHSFVYLKILLTKIIDEEEDALESISYSIFQRLLNFSKNGNILNIYPMKISLDFLILICEFDPVATLFFNSPFFFSPNLMGQDFHLNSILGSILSITTFFDDNNKLFCKIYDQVMQKTRQLRNKKELEALQKGYRKHIKIILKDMSRFLQYQRKSHQGKILQFFYHILEMNKDRLKLVPNPMKITRFSTLFSLASILFDFFGEINKPN